MAGMLRNRSIPTRLELQLAAALRNQQIHECPDCGKRIIGPYCHGVGYTVPRCEYCGTLMLPLWDVRNRRGLSRGTVCGLSESDAEESVRQTPQFDRMSAFCVVPLVDVKAK